MSEAKPTPKTAQKIDENSDEEVILDALEKDIPNWTENEKNILAILGLSSKPLPRDELSKKANVDPTYIYRRDNLLETGVLETIKDGRRKLWTTTERGDALIDRFKDKKAAKGADVDEDSDGDVFDDELDESDAIDEDQEYAFRCNLCGKGFDCYGDVRDHINDSVGKHRGRSPQEPGVISANPNLTDSLPTRFQGAVTTKGDIGPKTVRKGNVTTVGSVDATGGKAAGNGAKNLREPTTIQTRRVKTTQSENTDDKDDERQPFMMAELSREEVFEVLSSDAPESFRRRLYDQIVGESDDE